MEIRHNISTPQRRIRQRSFENDVLMLAALCLIYVQRLRVPRLLALAPIPRIRIAAINYFPVLFMEQHIGYSSVECQQMFIAYGFPAYLILLEGTPHAYRVNFNHCFLYFLFRLKSTAARQSLDTPGLWAEIVIANL